MSHWINVCAENDVVAGTGVCALLGEEQVAIFKTRREKQLYAISNYDPIGKASVLSRGITGSVGGEVVVASPLYKQHFNLVTGECIEDASVAVKTYAVRVDNGHIQLKTN